MIAALLQRLPSCACDVTPKLFKRRSVRLKGYKIEHQRLAGKRVTVEWHGVVKIAFALTVKSKFRDDHIMRYITAYFVVFYYLMSRIQVDAIFTGLLSNLNTQEKLYPQY